MLTRPVFNNSDNALKFILTSGQDNDPVEDLSHITRVTITIDGQVYDSAILGQSVISWNETTQYGGVVVGYVRFQLGGLGIEPGYYAGSTIKVYDAANASGVVWTDDLIVPVQ